MEINSVIIIEFSVDSIKNAILNFIKKKNDEELVIFNLYMKNLKLLIKKFLKKI